MFRPNIFPPGLGPGSVGEGEEGEHSCLMKAPMHGGAAVQQQQQKFPKAGATAGETKKRGRPKKDGGDAIDAELRETYLTKVLIGVKMLTDEAEASRWLTLCLPNGKKMPPHAVGMRKDPADPTGQAVVGTPLYLARDVFDHIVDPTLQRASKWKRWQRLWKSSSGQDGPIVDHAMFIQEDGTCAAANGPRQDALIGFNGLEVLIDTAACETLTYRPRDFFFFETPPQESVRALAERLAAQGPEAMSLAPPSPLPPLQAPPAVNTEELLRQALQLMSSGIEQGASQATIQQMIHDLRLPPDRTASLREAASTLYARVARPPPAIHSSSLSLL